MRVYTQRPDNNTGNYVPYSFRTVSGFFNVQQSYLQTRVLRRFFLSKKPTIPKAPNNFQNWNFLKEYKAIQGAQSYWRKQLKIYWKWPRMRNKMPVKPLIKPLWVIFRAMGQPNTMQTMFYTCPQLEAFDSFCNFQYCDVNIKIPLLAKARAGYPFIFLFYILWHRGRCL